MIDYVYEWPDFIGNIGVAILLTTYFLNVKGRINSQGVAYNTANLMVAILLGINLYYKPNLSGILIEIVWAIVALYGLYNNWKNHVKTR